VASFSQSSEQTTASLAVSLGKSESRGPAASAGLSSLSRAMLVAVQGQGLDSGFDLLDRKTGYWVSGGLDRSADRKVV
jgi:hypothetical protein